ncbi:hypothetical protein D3C71_1879360 [compost metagenome]
MVFFTPPSVINTIVMVTCIRYCSLKEVRINQHRRSGHESTARMTCNSYPIRIDKSVSIRQLFYCSLFIGQSIITQVSITKSMVPF